MAVKTIKQQYIIDRSGSMKDQRKTVIKGFNNELTTMISEEQELNVRYLVTLTMFDTDAEVIFKDVPVAQVPKLTERTYSPEGGTALYDAIGMSIDTAMRGETDRNITIMTDGQENSSRKWKKAGVKTLIEIRQNENKWGFTYFGANQDAWAEGSSLGIFNNVNYTVANTGLAMNAMSMTRSAYATTATSGVYNVSSLSCNINESELTK